MPEHSFRREFSRRLSHSVVEVVGLDVRCSWSQRSAGTVLSSHASMQRRLTIYAQLEIKNPLGGTPKFFDGDVRLRFSIGYPWLKKFWSKTYHWLRIISWSWAQFYMILRNFSPNIPLFKIHFPKTEANVAPKCQFLGVFVKNITLAKDLRRKL